MLMKSENRLPGQCSDCPRIAAKLSVPCIGQFVLDRSYCRRASEIDERTIHRILAWVPPVPEVVYVAGGEASTEPSGAFEVDRFRPRVANAFAKLSQMKSCPHWQASSTCGC